MKRNKVIKLTIMALMLMFFCINSKAQSKRNPKIDETNHSANTPINKFRNAIYNTINNPSFKSNSFMPTFTVLKININKSGKVTDVKFSDSADTLFIKEFSKRKKIYDETALLEQYAKDNSLKNVSILIPVNYEPNYSQKRNFYYDNMEALMTFGGREFSGKAIFLKAITIRVLPWGNK